MGKVTNVGGTSCRHDELLDDIFGRRGHGQLAAWSVRTACKILGSRADDYWLSNVGVIRERMVGTASGGAGRL
jgi:hypothetical protein